MISERLGQNFGKKRWKEGFSVEETLKKAAKECGLDELPSDPVQWDKFIHGAEEAWQDCEFKKLNQDFPNI